MANTTMFKVHHAILRNRRKLESSKRCLCIGAKAKLSNAVFRYFNVEPNPSSYIFKARTSLFLHTEQIEENCKKLERYNVPPTPATHLIHCIFQRSHILEHKLRLLRELGVKRITVEQICVLNKFMNYDVETFKKACEVPKEVNVVENILNVIGCSIKDQSNLEISHEDVPVSSIYENCMSYHLKKNLGLEDKKVTDYVLSHRRYYSFKMIQETLDILTNDVGFNILKYPGALIACPRNINSVLNTLEDVKLAGMTPVEFVKSQPLIIFQYSDHLRKIVSILRNYDISEAGIPQYMKLFNSIDEEECIRRIESLKQMPEIWIYRRHPVFLHVIVHFEKSLASLEYLKSLREGGEIPFYLVRRSRRFIQRHQFAEQQQQSLKKAMCSILQAELKEYTQDAVNTIYQHPHCRHVKFLTMYNTMKYLKERFPIEVIAHSAQVLLYPCSVLAKALEIVQTEYSTKNGYHFATEHYLRLAQYLLEKSIGFNNDSVWYTDFPTDTHIPHLPPNYR